MLACLQTLPQLSAHTAAALRVGVPPPQIREAVYQLAPIIGFPRTLNAVRTVNEVFGDHGIALPLPDEGNDDDAGRYRRGLAEQMPLYGTEIRDSLADLPEPFNEALPRFLTEFYFGDFYTRGGLSIPQRELLGLCAFTALGDTSDQLGPHGRACLQVGHSKTVIVCRFGSLFSVCWVPASHCCYQGCEGSLAGYAAAAELEERPGHGRHLPVRGRKQPL